MKRKGRLFMMEKTLGNYDVHDSSHGLQALKETREKLLSMVSGVEFQELHYGYSSFPTVGAYLLHIAQIELWWVKNALMGESVTEEEKRNFYFQEKQIISAPDDKELSWFLARLAEARDLIRDYFNRLSDVEYRKPGPEVIVNGERHSYSPEWVISHLIDHEAYHRGQAAMVLKMVSGQREDWEHFNTPYLSL
ncbi:DinB family protein [Bacillus sp. NTK071]|uniref:DinB family protein n=1 Tax=Bacillus sp. NTK071 TaxID=2802175 RepID=UPI001A90A6E2|nr:DinB family protein [Bacillus sp. NTK071]MBN8207212.1 DinB family protein [Bacillus sp. NTK071]